MRLGGVAADGEHVASGVHVAKAAEENFELLAGAESAGGEVRQRDESVVAHRLRGAHAHVEILIAQERDVDARAGGKVGACLEERGNILARHLQGEVVEESVDGRVGLRRWSVIHC